MRIKFCAFALIFILGFCQGLIFIIPISIAAPTDSFKAPINTTIEWQVTSSTPLFGTNGSINFNITAIDNNFIFSLSSQVDVVWCKPWIANSSGLYNLTNGEVPLFCYNDSSSTLQTTYNSGYVYQSNYLSLMLPVPLIASSNVTAFDLYIKKIYFNKASDQSSSSGMIYSYWEGSANGDGSVYGSLKYVFNIDPTDFVVNEFSSYLWSGSSWRLAEGLARVRQSDDEPPFIPYLEIYIIIGIIIIITALIGIGLYAWKRKR